MLLEKNYDLDPALDDRFLSREQWAFYSTTMYYEVNHRSHNFQGYYGSINRFSHKIQLASMDEDCDFKDID